MATTIRSFINSCGSNIEEPVRVHLKNVYACLSLAMISATIGAYVDLHTNISDSLFTVIGAIGFLMAIRCTTDDGKNRQMRMGFLLGFAFCTGLGIGPLLEQVIEINPAIIPTAFFSTCLIFVSFSISSIFAKRGSWLYLGGIISTLFLGFFVTTLASIFFRSLLLFQFHLYIGLVLMCAFILYYTQIIMEKRRFGDKDFIGHSVDLFIYFVGIFKRILIILANKENEKKESKRR